MASYWKDEAMGTRIRPLRRIAGLAVLVAMFAAPVGMVQAVLDWQIETVDSVNGVGWYSSLALDSSGQPHISYFDNTNGELKYAAFDGSIWQIETVNSGEQAGWFISLALDSADQPHISYFDNTNGELKYAAFDGSAWQIETVDSAVDGVGEVGPYTSLAIDSADQPHISYLNNTTSTFLKYAAFDGMDWQIETVDSTPGSAGHYNSLALDSSDQPRISYFDYTDWDLKYAAFDGSAWQIETVDSAGQVGWYTSLAIDASDRSHISYYYLSDENLRYAAFDGSAWQIETVDSTGWVGLYTSLALDSSGRPHISYYDTTNDDLKYAAFDGSTWQVETVDSEENVGMYTSLALDSSGRPHISYFRDTNDDLKYARGVIDVPPSIEAGGPYSGVEGSAISLDVTTTDLGNDTHTTWSHEINEADPGTTCDFGDASQLETTFTCTDDGSFTLTLTADDGINPPVSDTAAVTISNADPAVSNPTATVNHTQVTITVSGADPGQNDTLTYAFNCDANDDYEVDAGATPMATCPLNPQQEGSFTFGIRVSDDDGGEATDTATITIATELCANDYTGVLRYDDGCRSYEMAITLPDDGPLTVCTNVYANGLLRLASSHRCGEHETSYVLPEAGPLRVCVNRHTDLMRAVSDLNWCTSHEFGRVLAATEVGETTPPRSR